jgi:hypothetical protein
MKVINIFSECSIQHGWGSYLLDGAVVSRMGQLLGVFELDGALI